MEQTAAVSFPFYFSSLVLFYFIYPVPTVEDISVNVSDAKNTKNIAYKYKLIAIVRAENKISLSVLNTSPHEVVLMRVLTSWECEELSVSVRITFGRKVKEMSTKIKKIEQFEEKEKGNMKICDIEI